LASNPTDYKSMLQRLVQVERDVILEYVVVNESGPPHKRVFTVEARLNNNIIGRGESTTKREAEQLAAKEALRLFGLQ